MSEARDVSITDFAWSHRPLVVFGMDEAAEDLATQRQRVEDARAGVAERDMVVFEVDGRRGTLDGQPITDASVQRLLDRYDPPEDGFRVLLVGKDSTVKLRRDEPITMQEVFETIDAMPMRQREMREASDGS